MKEQINHIVGSLRGYQENTGLVVGVVRGDHSSVFGYGKARQDRSEAPGGDTLFEIGSATKVFTAALLSILVAESVLNLDDPVRELVPALSGLAPEITPLRLATHTAGLPKMPSNLMRSMLRNRRDPYAAYSTDDLLDYLSRYKPRQKWESVRISYSNIGPALLGYLLAQKMSVSYEQALVSRICDPLGLHDTRLRLTPEQEARLATPHAANGKRSLNWDMRAFSGATALFSTANDLLVYLRANMGRPPGPLTEALQACHQIQCEVFAPQPLQGWVLKALNKAEDTHQYRRAIGLGWFVGHLRGNSKRIYWHHGASGGYRSFIGFVKESETGVVVLANTSPTMLEGFLSTTSTDDIGFRVMEYLDGTN